MNDGAFPPDVRIEFASDKHDIVTLVPHRAVSVWEAAVLRLLLPTLDAYGPIDLGAARVEAECRHCPSVWFAVEGPGVVRVGQEFGASAALHGADLDGMSVEILVIPAQGHVDHLEAWRGDGGRFLGLPDPTSMSMDPR